MNNVIRTLLLCLLASGAVAQQTFTVTNVADDGAGSLRRAIEDLNTLCPHRESCIVRFAIPAPVPANGWYTIEPLTPLPQLDGYVVVDGATQTQLTGNTNPDGPEIEISGARLTEGSGLRVRANCHAAVRNLVVNGFPGYGVEVRPHPQGDCTGAGHADITNNYLGTDARGRVAKPNQRGAGVTSWSALIADNVISGNQRAGIHVVDGFTLEIKRNRIGVGIDGSALGNGAGVFIDMGERAPFFDVAGADITENIIAYNRGMAVARSPRGELLISKNAIYENLQQGIDAGVDGMTPYSVDDRAVPNAPLLSEVAYDPVRNETTVRGRIESIHHAHFRRVELYSSSALSTWGTPQAEHSLGVYNVAGNVGRADFAVTVSGDLRGKWITATQLAGYSFGAPLRTHPRDIASERLFDFSTDTSELSNAIRVE